MKNNIKRILFSIFLLLILDGIWIRLVMSKKYDKMILDIQGENLNRIMFLFS